MFCFELFDQMVNKAAFLPICVNTSRVPTVVHMAMTPLSVTVRLNSFCSATLLYMAAPEPKSSFYLHNPA